MSCSASSSRLLITPGGVGDNARASGNGAGVVPRAVRTGGGGGLAIVYGEIDGEIVGEADGTVGGEIVGGTENESTRFRRTPSRAPPA